MGFTSLHSVPKYNSFYLTLSDKSQIKPTKQSTRWLISPVCTSPAGDCPHSVFGVCLSLSQRPAPPLYSSGSRSCNAAIQLKSSWANKATKLPTLHAIHWNLHFSTTCLARLNKAFLIPWLQIIWLKAYSYSRDGRSNQKSAKLSKALASSTLPG